MLTRNLRAAHAEDDMLLTPEMKDAYEVDAKDMASFLTTHLQGLFPRQVSFCTPV